MMPNRVLVTGATGFVGRQTLAPLLTRSFHVIGVARRPQKHVDVEWLAGDLLSAEDRVRMIAAARPTHLMHLAWVTQHGHYWEAPENEDWLAASLDLIARARDAGCRRIVISGSSAEYDWADPALTTGTADELLTPCRPGTRYGRDKLRLTQTLVGQSDAGIGRLFLLHGAGEQPNRLVPAVARALLAGRPVDTGPGTEIRDFLDSRDAGAAFAALVDSTVVGPVNIASGQGVALLAVVDRIAALLGRPDLVRRGARPAKEGDPPRLVANTRRLTQEVGFRPRIDLETGLANSVAWWRARRQTEAK